MAVGGGLLIGAALGTAAWYATRSPAATEAPAPVPATIPVTTLPVVGASPAMVPAALGRARKASSFHLRPTETIDSVGPELASGTTIDLLAQGSLTRDGSPIFRVHTPDGREGWTFVLASERI